MCLAQYLFFSVVNVLLYLRAASLLSGYDYLNLCFFQVHPQGASLDYVVSYVRALFPHVTQATVHHVLQKHDEVFRCATTGVGANIEHRWSFVAFEAAKTK